MIMKYYNIYLLQFFQMSLYEHPVKGRILQLSVLPFEMQHIRTMFPDEEIIKIKENAEK